jgi:hypothetical protein
MRGKISARRRAEHHPLGGGLERLNAVRQQRVDPDRLLTPELSKHQGAPNPIAGASLPVLAVGLSVCPMEQIAT